MHVWQEPIQLWLVPKGEGGSIEDAGYSIGFDARINRMVDLNYWLNEIFESHHRRIAADRWEDWLLNQITCSCVAWVLGMVSVLLAWISITLGADWIFYGLFDAWGQGLVVCYGRRNSPAPLRISHVVCKQGRNAGVALRKKRSGSFWGRSELLVR